MSATSLKEAGNSLFKHGRFKEAAEFYSKAELAAPSDPVYPANLSAALYELGRYDVSISAISRAWDLLRTDVNRSLALRLSIRFAKSLSHGARTGKVTPQIVQQYSEVIEELQAVALDEPTTSVSSKEPERVWYDWQRIADKSASWTADSEAARIRLLRLPILRKALDDYHAYSTIRYDDVVSLLDNWTSRHPDPIDLNKFPVERIGNLSFFVGGVGDARNVYATLIGLKRAYGPLSIPKRAQLRAHFTLFDFHPTILARDLVMFLLIHDLMEESRDKVIQNEIKATLFYLYTGVVMPSYCDTRFRRILDNLKARLSESPPRLPSWIAIAQNSVPFIMQTLNFWISLKKTTAGMLQAHEFLDDDPFSWANRKDEVNKEANKDAMREALSKTPDDMLATFAATFMPRWTTKQDAIEFCARPGVREILVEMVMKSEETRPGDKTELEVEWYKATKVFMPPLDFMTRHPKFKDFMVSLKKGKPSRTLEKQVSRAIRSEWKPNLTFFDPITDVHFSRSLSGYPRLKLDVFSIPRQVQKFCKEFDINIPKYNGRPERPSYDCMSAFFDAVKDALEVLQEKVMLEFVYGELTDDITKMGFLEDHTRSPEFPKKYTRIWLNNIPDFTHGLVNAVVYNLPRLLNEPVTSVGFTCSLNSGAWKGNQEYCYTYTLVPPTEIQKYLGCRLLQDSAVMGVVVVAPNQLPRPLSELASRIELTAWLTRVLLFTLVPPPLGAHPGKVLLPNNLVAFTRLLVYLQGVGYPAHWLSEFFQNAVSDTLVTDLGLYREQPPIPLSDLERRVVMRKVCFAPWKAELEVILANCYQGLPFHISLPADFATDAGDIGLFKASVRPFNSTVGSPWDEFSPFDPVMLLMFYDPAMGIVAEDLAKLIPDVLDGKTQLQIEDGLQVLTTLERMDFRKEIRWRLSRRRVKVMKERNYFMAGYRIDDMSIVTKPVSASSWKGIDDDSSCTF